MSDLKPTVLLVDDESVLLELLAQIVSDSGFDVVLASDGTSALEKVRKQKIDLVVSDIKMPGLDGIQFFHALRRQGFFQPFVFMSASVERKGELEALAPAPLAFLEKPIGIGSLLSLLDRFKSGD